MIEPLLALSFAFLAYIIYALVSEQIACNAKASKRPAQSAKALNANTSSKTATPAKNKSKTAAKKKPASKPAEVKKKTASKPASAPTNAIITYLGKNGVTSIAKITRELPAGKKSIQDDINKLIQEGKITQTIVGRAKSVALKS